MTTQETSTPKKKENFTLSSDPVKRDARVALKRILKNIPSLKEAEEKLKVIKAERKELLGSGDTEKLALCEEFISDVENRIKEIKSVFTPAEGSLAKANRIKTVAKIKSSDRINALKKVERELHAKKERGSINKIANKFIELRRLVISNVDWENEENINQNLKLIENYNKLAQEISEIIHREIEEVKNMSINSIRIALKENMSGEDLDLEIQKVRMEIQAESDKLGSTVSLTNILAETYDINDEKDSEVIKTALITSHIGMVQAMAYSVCSKGGLENLEYLKDVESAGFLALTGVANSYIEQQKVMKNNSSFKAWARINIINACKKELLNQKSGGRATASAISELERKEKDKIKVFLENYPEYRDFDNEIIKDFISGMDSLDNKKTGSASYSHIVRENELDAIGDEDEMNWSETITDDESYNEAEAQMEYEYLIESISKLLKHLNPVEKKLFLLYYGFEKKPEKLEHRGNASNEYTKTEIGEYLYDYCLNLGFEDEIGNNNKGAFSITVITNKIKALEEKIANIINENPELKQGFEYLVSYWLQNKNILSDMSNKAESVSIEMERNYLKRTNSADDGTYDIELADGSTLRDEYEPIESTESISNTLGDIYGDFFLDKKFEDELKKQREAEHRRFELQERAKYDEDFAKGLEDEYFTDEEIQELQNY